MKEGGSVAEAARTRGDVTRVADFLQGIFGHGRDYILGHPDVQAPGSVRYVQREGSVVAALVLEQMKLSFGYHEVPAARIELVGTARAFRKRGLCRLLINDAFAFLRAKGTLLAVIFGYPLFRKLGFEYCIPTYEETGPIFTPPGSAIIPTAGLETFDAIGTVDGMSAADLPRVAALHRMDNPRGNLSRLRPMHYWDHLVRSHGIESYRVVRVAGEIQGYFRVQASAEVLQAREVVALGDEACATICQALHREAQSSNAPVVTFFCPHNGTFGSYLRRYRAAEYWPFAERETTLQLKVLDLEGCLRQLRTEFSRRLRSDASAGVDGRYRIATEDESAVLDVRQGEVDVVRAAEGVEDITIPARRMAQLLSGFRPDTPAREREGRGRHERLVEALFPAGEPYWYVDDI